jgi:hypothetical protein
VRRAIGNTTGPLQRTGIALREIAKDAESIGLKPPAVVKELQGAVGKGEMTFDEMQRLRTQIGDRMSGAIVPEPGQDKTALKRIYTSLSEDIDFLAGKAGGNAKARWHQANDAFKNQIAAKRDKLVKIVGLEGEANPELVAQRLTSMASAKRGANIETLRAARETVGEDAWGELASSVVAGLGRTKDGFSLSRYRTDYANLSDAGKDVLFTPDHRQALDDIMTVSKRFEDLDKLANHSRSAVSGSLIGAGYAAVTKPLKLLASVIGARALAAMLAKPATAKATANWMKSYSALEDEMTEQTVLGLQNAALRLRDAMDREGVPAYPPLSVLADDQPINDEADQ